MNRVLKVDMMTNGGLHFAVSSSGLSLQLVSSDCCLDQTCIAGVMSSFAGLIDGGNVNWLFLNHLSCLG